MLFTVRGCYNGRRGAAGGGRWKRGGDAPNSRSRVARYFIDDDARRSLLRLLAIGDQD
jgi:hypothetical protein